mmetsp:Transcript_55533/g.91978  ORF Transcript_55533/g.91978 Transcript_55533/m.91978 type:complete len:329 (-) Transcript_55533:364-1350(-)
MGAIVTTFYIPESNPMSHCGILKWCRNAHRLVGRYSPKARVIVFTNDVPRIKLECPRADVLPFEARLVESASRFDAANPTPENSFCPSHTLLKWQIVQPQLGGQETILYLDADVDADVLHLDDWPRSRILELMANFTDDPCRLRATPDHSSPLNTGLMLVKPSAELYFEGVTLIETLRFNVTHGFNLSGMLQATVRRPRKAVKQAKGWWRDTWDFICGAGDQGLFTTVFMARHEFFCMPSWGNRRHFGMRPALLHYWGPQSKPWHSPYAARKCPAYFSFVREKGIPHDTPCARKLHKMRPADRQKRDDGFVGRRVPYSRCEGKQQYIF